MDDVAAMRVRKRIGDVDAVLHGLADGQRPLGQPRGQRLPVDIFHGDEGSARILADFVDGADGRMIERRRASRFPQQALLQSHVVGIGMEHFDGERTLERGVVGAEDGAHTAGAEKRVYPVAAQATAEESVVGIREVRHLSSRLAERGPRPAERYTENPRAIVC